MNIINRIGEFNFNSFGSKFEIIEYVNAKNVIVKFENGYETTCIYCNFKNGEVKSPYCKTKHGVGYLGEGKYKFSENGCATRCNYVWSRMIERCYSEGYKNKHKTYKDCIMCEEWHNFQVFAQWYENNYYELASGERVCLDKDILFKNNKLYSPDNCRFVPQTINALFTKCDASRGKYPIGIREHGAGLQVQLNRGEERVTIGTFYNEKDAFFAYKTAKEKYIKEVADNYKQFIPKDIYVAMYEYAVDITD